MRLNSNRGAFQAHLYEFIILSLLSGFGRNQLIQFCIRLEAVHEWHKRAAVTEEAAAGRGVYDIVLLTFGNMEQLRELFRVPWGLVEHDHAL